MRPLQDQRPYDKAGALALCVNYNDRFRGADPALGRDTEMDRVTATLIRKNKPNPLLVGPAGVGKTRIVEELARRIEAAKVGGAPVPERLAGSTVYELPLSNLVSGCTLVGQLEEKLNNLVACFEDPDNDLVLFIDEVHQLMEPQDTAMGRVSQVLKPALARGDMRVIGATTTQEVDSFLRDPAFMRRFSKVVVDELSRESTIEILKDQWPSYQEHYRTSRTLAVGRETTYRRSATVTMDEGTLEYLAVVADAYTPVGSHRPDSALTLLDQVCADAAAKMAPGSEDAAITKREVKACAIAMATGSEKAPDVSEENLVGALSHLVGQERAVRQVVSGVCAMRRNLRPRKSPLSFLLCGPSGVGKTDMAESLSMALYGRRPIRVDMSGFHDSASINRLIGSPAGYIGSDSNAELPFDILDTNPYQVVLLDELEKAAPEVQMLFLSVLDDGGLRTARGKLVDFSRAIVIATTNAGFTGPGRSRSCGFAGAPTPASERSGAIDALKQEFPVELLNRFDDVVSFRPMGRGDYRAVVARRWRDVVAEARSYNSFAVSQAEAHSPGCLPEELPDEDLDRLVEETYIPETGAREAEKAVDRELDRRMAASEDTALRVAPGKPWQDRASATRSARQAKASQAGNGM